MKSERNSNVKQIKRFVVSFMSACAAMASVADTYYWFGKPGDADTTFEGTTKVGAWTSDKTGYDGDTKTAATTYRFCRDGAGPSLIVVRQEEHLELNREKFKAILDIHRRYPGSCDEFWMSDRDFFRTFADLTNHLEATEACRADFERAGVKIAFQQGFNLGHWYNGDIETFRAAYPKGAEIFSYDRDGKVCEGFLCPRSPEVLDRERKYVELVVKTLAPPRTG